MQFVQCRERSFKSIVGFVDDSFIIIRYEVEATNKFKGNRCLSGHSSKFWRLRGPNDKEQYIDSCELAEGMVLITSDFPLT